MGGVLRQVAHAPAAGRVGGRHAEDGSRTLRRVNQAQQDLDQRRLARAVGADQAEDPARLDRWQREYGFDYALVETGGPFDRHLASTDRWTRLARTPAATLYERRM